MAGMSVGFIAHPLLNPFTTRRRWERIRSAGGAFTGSLAGNSQSKSSANRNEIRRTKSKFSFVSVGIPTSSPSMTSTKPRRRYDSLVFGQCSGPVEEDDLWYHHIPGSLRFLSPSPPWGLPPGSGALQAGSEALPADSEALPAGSEAPPAGSKAHPA